MMTAVLPLHLRWQSIVWHVCLPFQNLTDWNAQTMLLIGNCWLRAGMRTDNWGACWWDSADNINVDADACSCWLSRVDDCTPFLVSRTCCCFTPTDTLSVSRDLGWPTNRLHPVFLSLSFCWTCCRWFTLLSPMTVIYFCLSVGIMHEICGDLFL